MKKILLTIAGILFFFYSKSDVPEGYYSSAEGLSESALRTALHNIIDDHTVKTYGDARYILNETDKDPNNSSNVILVYSGFSVSGSWDGGATWNREHIWSKSHGFPNESDVPYSDLHNLKPSHPDVNTDRSDKDFDEGDTQHDIATGCYYTSTTWEPRDEVKGDIARIMFYMIVRYEGDANGEPDLELVENITSYPDPEFGIFSTLLQWHYDDPVDDFERNRNDIIYSHQQNRNPFIDHPEYVSKIWGGGGTNPAPTISNVSNIPEIPTDSEEVNIIATLTDDGNILSAEIRWGLISGVLLDTISMTNTSGDEFTSASAIPAQNNGNTVYFEVAATDDSSGTSVSNEYNYTVNNNPPSIILDEQFTSCPASGWTAYSVSGSEDWECSSYGYVEVNAYGGTGASDDWLITPALNLDLYSDEYLTFRSWTKYTDTSYPTIELKYSTDYSGSGDPNAANWTDLSATWSDENSQNWTSSGEIDLSTISGTDVYIAFRYTSSGTASGQCAIWEIDDVFISEKANHLPEISQISHSPENPTNSQNIDVTATITDTDGSVSSAYIKWGNSSGTYANSVLMSNTGDVYTGTIPSQSEGTLIYYTIEATDNVGETYQSSENIVSVNTSGNSLPQLGDLVQNPELPGSEDQVNISARINDSDGSINIAKLKWGSESGNYLNSMDMTSNGDDFTGFIPVREENTNIYYIIKAVDNDGGIVKSSEKSYIVNNAPEISNVSISPENPTQDNNVLVKAIITDNNSSIESAVLKWKAIDASNFTDISMTLSGGFYEAEIPKQEKDSVVFTIVATDEYSKESSYSSGYKIDITIGMNSIQENDLLIYPNPATDIIYLSVNGITDMNVFIYNLEGKLVYSESISNANDYKIYLESFKPGLYLIKVESEDKYHIKKLLIK